MTNPETYAIIRVQIKEVITMKATSYTIIQVPLSDAAIEYAERYCGFYENAEFFTTAETVTITHRTTIDPTDTIFWPGNQIF